MVLYRFLIIASTAIAKLYGAVPSETEAHCLWPSHTNPCKYCVRGWFGEDCGRNCSNCDVEGCAKDTGRCFACKNGFYSDSCSLTCPSHCRESHDGTVLCDRDSGVCLENCKHRWWGEKCHKRCNENCQDSACLSYDGSCVWGCKQGWAGGMCTENCPEECWLNKCTTYGKCMHGCNVGFYGEMCGKRCNDNCQSNDCYFNDIINETVCRDGCRDGWMSAYCNKLCPNGCKKCNQYSGECSSCKANYWGTNCDKQCNSSCVDSHCNVHGFCTDGCKDGFHGRMCTLECDTNCIRCNQTNGECLACKGKWSRGTYTCSETVLEYQEDGGESHDEGRNGDFSTPKTIIIGCISAAVVIMITIVMTVMFCRRRKLTHREDRRNSVSSQSYLQCRGLQLSRRNLDVL